MRTTKLKNLSKKDYRRIVRRSFGSNEDILPKVKEIMNQVKKSGEGIILAKYQQRYGVNYSLKVTKDERQEAYKSASGEFIQAIQQMVKNVRVVHEAQLPKKIDTVVYPEKGIAVWREWRPIEKVGLYIPGGKAIYPSSVLMTAIPAQIAGCEEIIICSPPQADGRIAAEVLVAADMAGVKKIFKVGGVEAISAMAYGTKTIPRVYKIFGAGNSFVTAAKLLALETTAIDMPAGPSEIFVIADETANPAFIAADLLADGEHGEDSACVLITTSEKIAEQTIKEIETQLVRLSTAVRVKEAIKKYGLFAVVDSLDKAVEFANEYAPEHLEIMTRNSETLIEKIKNAGSVFVGNYTTKSAGDYATGANHILPTDSMAKMYPPLSVESFGKWMQVQKCSKEGLKKIKETIETVAEIEQLPAHKNATKIRFKPL